MTCISQRVANLSDALIYVKNFLLSPRPVSGRIVGVVQFIKQTSNDTFIHTVLKISRSPLVTNLIVLRAHSSL